ncbi:hypothetical protein CC1G_14967 [Coprinopsis cinerea okayama7|uniref:BTB domain-containing protein n=1 Tax=Coprinopsis cinerea (strain Okayama-7 / 130 / ATCC MYA-4618 / FGSC 9003) TaxID=240176 RepID=D6RP99_COPC7|nr:hypothetical protein CC1G_14967 [Coprinopsis cinerea okayama7\|eukprot:XP_002910636.1 hypothetical protein CC1G_14967 [Coprinopsis cinerea okayama7\
MDTRNRDEDVDIGCDSEDSLLDEKELLNTDEMDHSDRPTWTKDGQYYFEDGSCVILIKDTLFNVHRSVLSKDGSTFSTMFSPRERHSSLGLPEEGKSEDNPIVLHGDSPQEFRDFLWAMYALPHELRAVTSPTADLTQLINIARISNKYAFKSVETWALEAIQDYVNRKPSPILSTIPSPATYTYSPPSESSPQDSTAHLTRLISLAQLCGHTPLLDTLVNFLRELMSSSLHYAYLAMTLADENNLRSLRGAAYLEVMQKAKIVPSLDIDLGLRTPSPLVAAASSSTSNSTSVSPQATNPFGSAPVQFGGNNHNTLVAMANAIAPLSNINVQTTMAASTAASVLSLPGATSTASLSTTPSPDPSSNVPLPLTSTQQLRLLSGYYRLSGTWEQLRLSPPHFDHSTSCTATWHQHGCTQSWLEFWKEKTRSDAVLGLGTADVIGRVKVLQRDFDRWGTATYMHPDCRVPAKKALAEVVRKVEDALGDYFSESGK